MGEYNGPGLEKNDFWGEGFGVLWPRELEVVLANTLEGPEETPPKGWAVNAGVAEVVSSAVFGCPKLNSGVAVPAALGSWAGVDLNTLGASSFF
jgi:hypothetical protein